MSKTKIVATLGPSSDSLETIGQPIRSGVSILRLNMSHGTHEQHADHIQRVRQAAGNRMRKRQSSSTCQGRRSAWGVFRMAGASSKTALSSCSPASRLSGRPNGHPAAMPSWQPMSRRAIGCCWPMGHWNCASVLRTARKSYVTWCAAGGFPTIRASTFRTQETLIHQQLRTDHQGIARE